MENPRAIMGNTMFLWVFLPDLRSAKGILNTRHVENLYTALSPAGSQEHIMLFLLDIYFWHGACFIQGNRESSREP